MNDVMKFPKTFEEFIKQYSFFDKQQIYTNGSELIHVFRIKQWEEHKEKENQELKNIINQIGFEPDKIVFLQQENAELKKQVEEANEKIILLQASEPMLNYKKSLEKTQQKEFIKYLEDEVNKWRNNYDSYNYEYEVEEPTVEELVNNILQRFKEITGMSDEKEN